MHLGWGLIFFYEFNPCSVNKTFLVLGNLIVDFIILCEVVLLYINLILFVCYMIQVEHCTNYRHVYEKTSTIGSFMTLNIYNIDYPNQSILLSRATQCNAQV